MSTLDQVIRETDNIAADAANARAANNQERWDAQREDRENLRESLESGMEHFDDPKPRKKDDDNPEATIREDAERAWDRSMNQSALADIERKQFEEFQHRGKLVKRSHGIDSAVEAFDMLYAADKALRTNPEAAFNWLAQNYGDGRNAQAVAQHEQQAAMAEVTKFFDAHEIGADEEQLILHAIKSGEVQRSGDIEKDLRAAYRIAKKGQDRVARVR